MFGYGFKGERDEHIADIQRAFYDMDSAMPEHQRYFSWAAAALSRRTVSSDETLFRLTGADMIYRSRHPVYCNVMPPDSRPTTFIMRKSHQLAASGTALPNTQLVWLARYYARPSSGNVVLHGATQRWDSMCLRTCLKWFEFSESAADAPSQPVFALRDGSGWYRQKRKEQIVVLAYDPDISKQPEQWAYTRLMLYWPHRDENTLLLDPTTGTQMSATCRLEQVMDHHLFQLPDADRRLFSERGQLQATLDALQETASKIGPLDNAVELPGLDPADTQTRPETLPTAERSVYNEVLPKLTIQQQRLVAIAHETQIFQQNNPDAPPLSLFVSGEGGSGKSTVCKAIRQQMGNTVKIVVLAPTGSASFDLFGETVHSGCGLPVEEDGPAHVLRSLGKKKLMELRAAWQGVRWLIVDEVSMVSNKMATWMDQRLRVILDCEQPFGGINVIWMGDFFQLPPVSPSTGPMERFIFEDDPNRPAHHASRLWRSNVLMLELDVNHRAGDDRAWQELLSSVRVGQRKPEFMHRLHLRVRRTAVPMDGTILCALRKDVHAENNRMLANLQKDTDCDVVTVRAHDLRTDSRGCTHAIAANDCTASDSRKTGGLETELSLAVGARVSVCRNVRKADGVVNGALGTVMRIGAPDEHSIPRLSIKFDNEHVGVIQRRMTGEKDITFLDAVASTYRDAAGRQISRFQLPVHLAWSTSIHKSQGKTYDKICADLGSVFSGRDGAGMAYVALSRCKTEVGVTLLAFKNEVVFTNPWIVAEMVRLRQHTAAALSGEAVEANWGARVARLMTLFLQDANPPDMPDYTKHSAKRGAGAPSQDAKRHKAQPACPVADSRDTRKRTASPPPQQTRKRPAPAPPAQPQEWEIVRSRLGGVDPISKARRVEVQVSQRTGTPRWVPLDDCPEFVRAAFLSHSQRRHQRSVVRLDGWRNLCLFRAVYGSLHPTATVSAVKTGALELRNRICAEISANHDLVRIGIGTSAQPSPWIEDCYLADIDAYERNVQSGLIMGGDLELSLANKLLGSPVCIWFDDRQQIIKIHEHSQVVHTGSRTAHIIYNGVNHYDIYVPQ